MSLSLTTEQIERYSRQILVPDFGGKGQIRLSQGRVLIIGAGGLGSSSALYLAAAGTGTLGLIDADNVELSNLQRQILHGTADLGKAKVESGKETLNQLNPDVEVISYPVRLDSDNIDQLFSQYQFIIDGSDNFHTKFLVNDAAVRLKKPYSHAGIVRWQGQTMTVIPGKTACYRCLFKEPPPPGEILNCQQSGVLGAVAGTIGSIQATEAIKYLVGFEEELLTDRLLTYDARAMKFHQVEVTKDPYCKSCRQLSRTQPPLSRRPKSEE
ncbi:MAG TPA: HesA/MoeB/ThiF family protein [Candidatus Polarisedimenticolaceae bacterium]|nr:HesA/MoeB/ThiF family protein [Candidatus Polarisedimenticolaceae bacterium]